MLHLTVKNFGVLKDIDIELNHTNLFIGDNGSGKSTLAKLITVLTDYTIYEENIIRILEKFNINFLHETCFIQLKENDKSSLEIVGLKVRFSTFRKELLQKIKRIDNSTVLYNFMIKHHHEKNHHEQLEEMTQNDQGVLKDILNVTEKTTNTSIDLNKPKVENWISSYIPAERNLISLFNQSLSNMVIAEIPLPKILLEFSANYNSAKNKIKELDILNMKYKNVNAQDRIYYGDYTDDNFLALENSSSGIQSALPLYLTLKYFASKHKNIIVEEPELNLYPKSQIDTVKFMIENRGESDLSIMTHSPYILSILNVLIFAYKATNANDVLKEKISTIIPIQQQINPDEFSAYLIEDGISKSIKGKSTGMIQENVIDDIGDGLTDNFEELMEIYREFKNDK